MRLVGCPPGSGRRENFPGCNRHVTDNLPCEMRDLTRELSSRCEESASHAEKLVGSDLPPKNGRSGRPHKTSNNICAPSHLPYMVWLVGWLGGRPIRRGFGIGVAASW